MGLNVVGKAVLGYAILGLVLVALLLAACGGSSKPSYCSAINDLQDSIKALPSTDVIANGTSALKSALTKVQDNANAAVDAAKSDFPNETSSVKTSVESLSTTINEITRSPAPQTIAQLPGEASAVATAAKNLTNAASSKCG
jgi:hypothetical protein